MRVVFLDFDAVEPMRPARSWRRAAVDEVEDFAGAGPYATAVFPAWVTPAFIAEPGKVYEYVPVPPFAWADPPKPDAPHVVG